MNEKQIRRVHIFRGCILALAAVMITVGVVRGEVDVVLKKAVRICLECIGVAG